MFFVFFELKRRRHTNICTDILQLFFFWGRFWIIIKYFIFLATSTSNRLFRNVLLDPSGWIYFDFNFYFNFSCSFLLNLFTFCNENCIDFVFETSIWIFQIHFQWIERNIWRNYIKLYKSETIKCSENIGRNFSKGWNFNYST